MAKAINFGKFVIEKGELIYLKHCNFKEAILWITKEMSIPLTLFEDIKSRDIKKMVFVNTDGDGELGFMRWEFKTKDIDQIKVEKKMFQETQYYFSVADRLPKKEEKKDEVFHL